MQTLHNCECLSICQTFVDMRKKMDTCHVNAECKGAYYDVLRQHWRDCCHFAQDEDQESQRADKKLRYLLSKIYSDSKRSPPPDLILVMSQSVITTFLNNRDEMPAGRAKVLHSAGWHSSFKFKPVPHFDTTQTGVLGEESVGVVRFSMMRRYEGGTGQGQRRWSPAVALKFLRNGVTSCNVLTMPSMDGQTSINFFEKEFKTHVKKPMDFINKVILNKFEQASKCVLCTGLKHCAQFDSDGDEVEQDDIRIPQMIGLKPKVEFDEFNLSTLEDLDFAFINIESHTDVFDVYAYEQPENLLSNHQNQIGTIQIMSPITTSNQGDNSLFFRHQQFEEDLALNPHWIETINDKEELQCGRNCLGQGQLTNNKCS